MNVHAWLILRWVWAAVVIVYCVLAFIADRRLRGVERKRNRAILTAIAVLVAVRFAVQRVFGGGLIYEFAVVTVGSAAGVAALVVAKMLATREPSPKDDEEVGVDGEERIQSLKLN